MPADDRLVLDSSVLAAILLREPGHEVLATRLSSLRSVCAGPFFRFEVANALWKQKDWSLGELNAALEVLFSLPVDETFTIEDARVAMTMARTHNHPFYDTAFVALAQGRSLPLWTLDKRQAALASMCGVVVAPATA